VYLVAATVWIRAGGQAGRRTIGRLTAGLLLGYWAAMTLVPIPGGGAGSLTKEANLAQYLDALVLTGHMWQPTWDPEGILSTVPAVATCLLGALAGEWVRGRTTQEARRDGALGLFAAGASIAVLGWIWGGWFPINKTLWTSSYVLLTGGLALVILGWLEAVIGIRGHDRWTWPFVVYGSNALLVFVLTGLVGRLLVLIHVGAGDVTLKAWIYQQWFASWAGPVNGSLAFAVAFMLIWLLPMGWLYRRGLILRI
jgi:predicted acyltransferase